MQSTTITSTIHNDKKDTIQSASMNLEGGDGEELFQHEGGGTDKQEGSIQKRV